MGKIRPLVPAFFSEVPEQISANLTLTSLPTEGRRGRGDLARSRPPAVTSYRAARPLAAGEGQGRALRDARGGRRAAAELRRDARETNQRTRRPRHAAGRRRRESALPADKIFCRGCGGSVAMCSWDPGAKALANRPADAARVREARCRRGAHAEPLWGRPRGQARVRTGR